MGKVIMKTIFLTVIAIMSFPIWANSTAPIPIITQASELEDNIGKLITIKGMVFNSKIPTILGVDVSSNNPDLRKKIGCATGILSKFEVTTEEHQLKTNNRGLLIQSRGPGVFYRLIKANSNQTSHVQKC